MIRLFLAACLACLATLPEQALANTGQDVLGQGARAKAMGGAATASASDSSATYYNPAGLGECAGNEISLGVSHLRYNMNAKSDDERSEKAALRNRTSATVAGCVKLPARLRAGFLFDTGLGHAQRLEQSSIDSRPEFALYGNALEQISMIAGLGMRVNQKFSVGIGGAMLLNSGLGVGVSVPIVAGEQELGGNIEWNLEPAAAFYAGGLYRPSDNLRFGASLRTALFHKLEATALTTVDVAGVLLDVDLLLESVAWYSPLQASIGAAYEHGGTLLSVDVTWYHWSAYPGPFLHISPVEPDDSIAAALNYPPNEEPAFSDIFVPRIGGEHTLSSQLLVRGGVAYRPSPAPLPKPEARANVLDAAVTTLSAGLAYSYRGGSVSLYTRAHYMQRHTVRKEVASEPDLTYRFGGLLLDAGLELSSAW